MRNIKSKTIYITLFSIIAILSTLPVYADPGDLPGGDGGCDPFNPGPGYCPLDSWVIGFAVLALIVGYRQLKNRKVSL